MFTSVPPPILTVGGTCGRVVMAAAADFCSNVSVLIDLMRTLRSPLLSCWKVSVETPRQRSPLL